MLRHLLILVAARLVMLVKVGLEGEALVTLAALVVLEGCVCLHVGPQVGSVRETFATVGAAEWLVSSVRPFMGEVILQMNSDLDYLPQMSLQKPGPREGLATCVTLVVEAVGEHVHREGGHADVHLAADPALLGCARGEA